MASYHIDCVSPDGREAYAVIQTSDPDAAVTCFKEQFPDYQLVNIVAKPDIATITNCTGSRSFLIQTPYVHLNVPTSWDLPELKDVVQYCIDNQKDTTDNKLYTEYTDEFKSLFTKLTVKVIERL